MEIEKKYRLSHEQAATVLRTLKERGVFKGSDTETDTYFNVGSRDSYTTKECLRIRRRGDEFHEITYKPPTIGDDQLGYFAKEETNMRIQDAIVAKKLLQSLGNTVLVEVEKNRQYFEFEDCTVCFDEIRSAGIFVEIEVEGQDEVDALTKINKCANILGFTDDILERMPYRDIVWECQHENC